MFEILDFDHSGSITLNEIDEKAFAVCSKGNLVEFYSHFRYRACSCAASTLKGTFVELVAERSVLNDITRTSAFM